MRFDAERYVDVTHNTSVPAHFRQIGYMRVCPVCRGTGGVMVSGEIFPGFRAGMIMACPRCGGDGVVERISNN